MYSGKMINGRMSIGVNIHMGVHSKEVKCSHICTGMWSHKNTFWEDESRQNVPRGNDS